MTEQSNAELIAENRKWVRLHQANSHQAEAARRMTRVLDALEAADQRAERAEEQRDEWAFRAGDRDALEDQVGRLEQRAAEYAAVVEKAVGLKLARDKQPHRAWPDLWDKARRILTSASDRSTALREHDATLVEGLADEVKVQADSIREAQLEANKGYLPLNIVAILGGYGQAEGILREKARQRREEQS